MAKARKKWIVGVDLGGTNIVVGLLPIDGGDVLGLRILPTESHKGPKFVVNRIVEMVNAAIAQAEALRRAVAQEAFAHPASPLAPHMTISMGVAALVPTADTSPEQLVAAADRAMYAAKAAGRDRVAWGAMARRA